MAMCIPTSRAVAVAVVLLVQFTFEQTLKVPTSPTAGGAGATRGAVKGWIVGGLLRYSCCSLSRRNWWNRAAGASPTDGAMGAGAGAELAARVAPRNKKDDLPPGVPVAAWGTSRYSMPDPDWFAANATQPGPRTVRRTKLPLGLGSADRYSPAVRLTSGAPGVHGASGPVDSLHPTARSEHTPIRLSTFSDTLFLLCFAGEAQDPPEADRAYQLVDPNHRHDQGLERDPPLRERPPRHAGEPQRYPSLRDKSQPPLPRQDRPYTGVPTRPGDAAAQGHDP